MFFRGIEAEMDNSHIEEESEGSEVSLFNTPRNFSPDKRKK